jgi:hypothetical protein
VESNPMAEVLKTAKNSAITTRAVELADKINADIVEARDLGRSQRAIERLFAERRKDMALQLLELVETETNSLKASLTKAEDEWNEAAERGLHARASRLEIAKVRYSAMSDAELHQELDRVTTAEFITGDPVETDALFVAAKAAAVDVNELAAYRQTALETGYQAPWTQNAEARQAVKEIAFYESTAAFEIPAIGPDGSTFAVDYGDLLDGTAPQGMED